MPSRRIAIPALTLLLFCAAGWNLVHAGLQGALWATAVSAVLAVLVRFSSTGTAGAAVAGFVCCLSLSAATRAGLLHSGFPCLLLALLLTTFATRVGRGRKRAMHAEQDERGRDASQVYANLAVAAGACALPWPFGAIVATAALAECAADTLASELGVLAQSRVWLITGGWAAAGTDGGVTLPGTSVAMAAAAAVAGAAVPSFGLSAWQAVIAGGAGFGGCVADSVLGATLERRGLLRNNAVNFLSTLIAGLLAGGCFALL